MYFQASCIVRSISRTVSLNSKLQTREKSYCKARAEQRRRLMPYRARIAARNADLVGGAKEMSDTRYICLTSYVSNYLIAVNERSIFETSMYHGTKTVALFCLNWWSHWHWVDVDGPDGGKHRVSHGDMAWNRRWLKCEQSGTRKKVRKLCQVLMVAWSLFLCMGELG